MQTASGCVWSVEAQSERMSEIGVRLTQPPVEQRAVTKAALDDTY
jgi:hypothetical protein